MGKRKKISPDEYKKILSGIELKNIILQKSKTYYNISSKTPDQLSIKINDSSDFKILEDGLVNLFQTYELDARKPDSKSRYIQIEVTFVVTLHSKYEFTEGFFEIYKEISLPLNTWPFFREFVNQMTSRMNVPPLTLPLLKTN